VVLAALLSQNLNPSGNRNARPSFNVLKIQPDQMKG
jgi:hypothetical protein